jgi:serine/threonine protein kinase
MKTIKISDFFYSGLQNEFSAVSSIEVHDTSSFAGNFGDVYKCYTVNGKSTTVRQIIKIFRENHPGSLKHNTDTILKIQKKISELNQDLLKTQGKGIVELYPALLAVPQFSFKGVFDGQQISGFSANDLSDLGFTDFEEILRDGNPYLTIYRSIPIEKKILIAYHLVAGFKVLEDLRFIHADIKPSALFVNLTTFQCAIIDFDSGVITESPNDEPNTWGAKGDWIAPEIYSQLDIAKRGDKINVDLFTDRWSVMIAIHYLITTHHPLFFLEELSPRYTDLFLRENKWPYVNVNAKYFDKLCGLQYNDYTYLINKVVPPVLVQKIAETINYGYRKPVTRTSYLEWKKAIESIFSLPEIILFEPVNEVILEGQKADLIWETKNAISVIIDNGIGNMPVAGQVQIAPACNTTYKLKAIGHFGQVEMTRNIKVHPMPTIESIKIPMPDMCMTFDFVMPDINLPSMNCSISLPGLEKLELNSFTFQYPHINEISNPLFAMRDEFWIVSKVFDLIKEKISN